MEWSDFFDGLAKEAARDFTTWGWYGDPALHTLTAQKYAWEWQGDTFHIQSKSDDTFYMEFTLPKPGDDKMTVTMAGYCKLVSYTVQFFPNDEDFKTLLKDHILSLTQKLRRVDYEEGAQQLWHAFNETFQPETLWLEPDE